VASLVDTNVLVYRFDPRDPAKQRRAMEVLREGIATRSLLIAHQSVIEFVAVVTRPRRDTGNQPLLPLREALLEAERLMGHFSVLYPSRDVLVTAMRGTVAYGLPWFDAHIWATAEVHGAAELVSEDFQHGRHYGRVRATNPFLDAGGVHDLPALYEQDFSPRPRRRSRG
jgi:predicted nucleic acid-binding protein